jgi:hypothetical protein
MYAHAIALQAIHPFPFFLKATESLCQTDRVHWPQITVPALSRLDGSERIFQISRQCHCRSYINLSGLCDRRSHLYLAAADPTQWSCLYMILIS